MGWHAEWRKIAKKVMRKRKRRLKAQLRNEKIKEEEEKRAQSPSYKIWLEEQKQLEIFNEEEEEKKRIELHSNWLKEEQLAMKRWNEQQERLDRIKAEKAKQDLIIKEEWEREQAKLQKIVESQKREKEMREREQAELFDKIEKYINGECDTLPSSTRCTTETQPGCDQCPFFVKVAACRFRDSCSRNHIRPNISNTLLFPGFYTHFRMDHVNTSNEYDTDVGLEFDDKEIYQHFLEFYDDVLTELKSFGDVVQFKVCCNEEPHLRGNVYVQYRSERYALKAFRALQGRYYGGKQLSVEFCSIPSWSKALCGLFMGKKCPKGSRCNFMHVFRNPNREFCEADRDNISPMYYEKNKSKRVRNISPNIKEYRNSGSKRRRKVEEWRWSSSPEPDHENSNTNDYTSSNIDVKSNRLRTDHKSRSKTIRKNKSRHCSRSRSRARDKKQLKKNHSRNKEYISTEVSKHKSKVATELKNKIHKN